MVSRVSGGDAFMFCSRVSVDDDFVLSSKSSVREILPVAEVSKPPVCLDIELFYYNYSFNHFLICYYVLNFKHINTTN